MIVYDFSTAKHSSDWYVLDDHVMGGISRGQFTINDEGHGVFKGHISLENNGGFSSLRYLPKFTTLNHYTGVVLYIKGDGKCYQFRIKENPESRYSYVANFPTSESWEDIYIPFTDFYPSYRGKPLQQPNYTGDSMWEIGFLFGNQKEEDFELFIEKLELR